jgi:hypothetical protein
MARQKNTKRKKKHVFEDPQIEEIVEVEIEYICPKRGKVKQKVKMKKLKPVKVNCIQQISTSDEVEKIDEDQSLSIYSDDDSDEEDV